MFVKFTPLFYVLIVRKIRLGMNEYQVFFSALENAFKSKQRLLDFTDLLKIGDMSPYVANLTVFMLADCCIDDVVSVKKIKGTYVAYLKYD